MVYFQCYRHAYKLRAYDRFEQAIRILISQKEIRNYMEGREALVNYTDKLSTDVKVNEAHLSSERGVDQNKYIIKVIDRNSGERLNKK